MNNSTKNVVTRRKSLALSARLGKNIAARRKELAWTQEYLAELVGVDTETISRFERGATTPSLVTLENLAVKLDSRMAVLLGDEDVKPSSQSQVIVTWIERMKPKDRSFVMDFVRWYSERKL